MTCVCGHEALTCVCGHEAHAHSEFGCFADWECTCSRYHATAEPLPAPLKDATASPTRRWSCLTAGCPSRPPVAQDTAPRCYTCGVTMSNESEDYVSISITCAWRCSCGYRCSASRTPSCYVCGMRMIDGGVMTFGDSLLDLSREELRAWADALALQGQS